MEEKQQEPTANLNKAKNIPTKGLFLLASIAVIAVIAFAMVGGTTGAFSLAGAATQQTAGTKEFTVKAFRFGYTPDEITVNLGDKVKITIENTDTLHGARIPELGISGNNAIEFIAEKKGEFNWYCNNICGTGHGDMSGKLTVK